MKPSQRILALMIFSILLVACSSRSESPTSPANANAPASANVQSIPFSAEHWKAFNNGGVKDFEGKIGDKAEIELVIKSSNQPIRFEQMTVDGYGIYQKSNKPFPIAGMIDFNEKSFWVQEFAGQGPGKTGTFVGKFSSNNRIDGVWASSKGDTPFSLTEKTDSDKTELSAKVDQARKNFEKMKSRLPNEEDAGTNSLDDQAVNGIRQKYDTVYTKCGDSYYIKIGVGYYLTYTQFKEVSFSPVSRVLTDADKLNGVEWAGTVNVAGRFIRKSFVQSGLQHWGEYGSQAEPQHFRARKVKGKWELDDAFLALKRTYSKPTCAEIPKD